MVANATSENVKANSIVSEASAGDRDIFLRQREDRIGRKVVLILGLVYLIFSLGLCLSYHWGYLSTLTDLGTFDQAIWGTLSGDIFLNTHIFGQQTNYLGFHFRPILFLFVPFYALASRAEWLIVAQCIALAIAAWPIYLLARQVGYSALAACFWVLAFYANPYVINTLPWVFRPETLALPFIVLAFLAIEQRRYLVLFISCGMIMLCKEHFGLMVMGYGFLWGIRNRNWLQSLGVMAFGACYSIIVLTAIMPALSPTGKHVMLSSNLGQVSRYSWLGGSFSEIMITLVSKPVYVLRTMWKMGSILYLVPLLLPLVGFPLAAPEFLLVGVADLLANALSTNPMPRSLFAYHSVTLIPVILVAAIYGVKRISGRIRIVSLNGLTSVALAYSLVAGYLLAPLPLPGARDFWAPKQHFNRPDPTLSSVKAHIGVNSSLSAQANIGAHFSQRREIYQFPDQLEAVDAVVLWLDSPTNNTDYDERYKEKLKYAFQMLDAHLKMNRIDYINTIEQVLLSGDFGIACWNDPWLVLSRECRGTDENIRASVLTKLRELHKTWHIVP
ncbi:DUF2079 domain-containing protein [Planctomycetota bacterium]